MPDTVVIPDERIRRLLLAVPNRRRIFENIQENPGTHLRRLSRDLDLAIGSVEHHLRQLTRYGLLFSHQDGRRRSYYVRGDITPSDAAILHALQKPVWTEILLLLTLRREDSVATMARRLDMPPNTLSHHLRRLRDMGLLEHMRIGRQSVYAPRDPDRILRLHASLHAPPEGPDEPARRHAAFHAVVARARTSSLDGPPATPRPPWPALVPADPPKIVRDA